MMSIMFLDNTVKCKVIEKRERCMAWQSGKRIFSKTMVKVRFLDPLATVYNRCLFTLFISCFIYKCSQ